MDRATIYLVDCARRKSAVLFRSCYRMPPHVDVAILFALLSIRLITEAGAALDSRVVVISGPSKGAVVRMKSDQLTVGRDHANHLCLRDRAVSRRHFNISRTDVA